MQPRTAARPDEANAETRTVLVVDDDDDIRTVLCHNLEAEGYCAIPASSGDEALERVRASRPGLVILDVMMPERDGYDVLAALRSQPETADLPVMMLTARRGEADVWEGWSSGADYYMTKPFDLGELLRFVHFVFGT